MLSWMSRGLMGSLPRAIVCRPAQYRQYRPRLSFPVATMIAAGCECVANLGVGQPIAYNAGVNEQTNAQTPTRILLLTATAGFRHASIPTAIRVLKEITAESGDLTVTNVIEDVSTLDQLTAATLAEHD